MAIDRFLSWPASRRAGSNAKRRVCALEASAADVTMGRQQDRFVVDGEGWLVRRGGCEAPSAAGPRQRSRRLEPVGLRTGGPVAWSRWGNAGAEATSFWPG